MDSAHYHILATKHLGDLSTYKLLVADPSAQIVADYHHFLNICLEDKVLDKYQYCSLVIQEDYQISTIYFHAKLHKYQLKLRPIVASVKGITVNPPHFIYRILYIAFYNHI